MTPDSRVRRLQSFISWFNNKYQPRIVYDADAQDIVARIRAQKDQLTWFITEYQPECYWCGEAIQDNSFETFTDEKDPLTIHHVDEDREHNDVENLEICHRDCHQVMHKLSTGMGLPAKVVRAIRHSAA